MTSPRKAPLHGSISDRWRAAWIGTLVAIFLCLEAQDASARACVWKVTAGDYVLYLAGSVHRLRGVDYPLPAPYEEAFRASSALSFETDLRRMTGSSLADVARLPRGTTLRQHLDPKVWAYVQQVLARSRGSTHPEEKIEHLRPWAVGMLLQSPKGIEGLESGEGVETYLTQKAARAHKEITGLVPLKEHIAVFGGMNDSDGQAYMLYSFIGLNQLDKEYQRTVQLWKAGDVDGLARSIDEEYRDVPTLRSRIITDRNRRWVPVIEQYLRSGKTYMVVAGAAHMAGGEGVPALLKAKGYRVEQL